MFSLTQAQGWIADAKLVGDGNTRVERICTDSRQAKAGDLFVPLIGERFDAHAFIGQVIGAGVRAVLSAQSLSPDALIDGQVQRGVIHGLQVPDTTLALQQLAAGWRRQFALPVIAVTGSNGKTTVKEMIASILRVAYGEASLSSEGNLNNAFGVPMSVLRLRAHHRAAVFELGINQPGEMAQLCPIAQPTLSLVNNAQREHQEFLHGVEASARENGTAISQLPRDGIAVFPGDDQCAPIWQSLAGDRDCVCFGWDEHWPVHASEVTASTFRLHCLGQDALVKLRIAGRHSLRNALAAAACCRAIGLSLACIVQGLEQFEPVSGRLRQIPLHAHAQLIDDSYNANPDSVRAAIDVLAGIPGTRLLVLGDMGEVGVQGEAFHEEVGVYARTCGIDQLWLLGEATRQSARGFGDQARHFGSDMRSLVQALSDALSADRLSEQATVLIKGSRFMAMERVVKALTADQHVKEDH
ncbi:MAG: UDP-N-acetylmuramoyl-tripeptide--D-alanyl-D-alanine ligase [Betaproteobacteria bacterium]|nr:UDP-N-acetylmuramoyl-tripeptide--D-alanyl-D-alanine ligase [Betaproteobacteria bacterium]NBO43192.1 UDP-N-acetylmuramoyl-tripeptide--D-alanyl-D-alanine ligase [Betaproteobacteria bacterium]NBP09396.1 UDP-N-acetylmuramoyl-tripeptide--D-alanyl-D-alanine ligase [Betaproteobacteria bacterium]NBQ09443.1 UDP-N-acetylmuramoyl-tripeptide--D-alanyl-D-alanine ligase [Betaproteobacteria bacterium]NBQ80799.1 UDP-N-acetylmuramoyl-tripeptide--D-alanyl-D-alanine ligase [Betaproteobacteria bacterium]